MSARTAARIAWAAAALSAAMGIGGTAATQLSGLRVSGPSAIFIVAFVLSLSVIGALVVSRQPQNVFGWILTVVAMLMIFNLAGTAYARFAVINEHGTWPAGVALAWLASGWIWIPISGILLIFIPLLYPSGRLLSSRWRFAVWCAVGFIVLAGIPNALMPGPLFDIPGIRNPVGLEGFAGLLEGVRTLSLIPGAVGVVGAVASLVVRFRRARGQERQQLKWFLYGCIVFMTPLLVRGPVPNQIQQLLTILLWPALPISIAFAMLKYRLYDIDLVINKSLVYGALAVFITAVYVGIVVGIGTFVGSAGKPNLALSILATALVAVAFQPVRQRLQRFANRVVYGRRATPYEVMAAFSRGMAGVLSVDEVLPRMAQAAAGGVGARASHVRLKLPTGEKVVDWPPDGAPISVDRVMPVAYHGEPIGEIAVAMPPGASLTPADDALLKDLASQAGLSMHNARLTYELEGRLREISAQADQLQISRNRIVSAEGTERRRLEENIQAGVYRELTALAADLRATDAMLVSEPLAAAARLDSLAEACNRTLERLRDLARGIYPPLLRDQGLTAALRAQLAKLAIQADVTADGVGRYPEEVEAAVYFACVEALAGATHAVAIRLTADGSRLEFTVEGVELPASRAQDIEDRVESLGGHLHRNGQPGMAAEIPASPAPAPVPA